MGFINRVKKTNITRHVFTQMAQITILCSLIIATGTHIACRSGEHCGLAFVNVTALFVTALTFIVWLIWSSYIIYSQKILTPMDAIGYKILDTIDLILFVYWIIAAVFQIGIGAWISPIMVLIWTIALFIAIKYRSIKDKINA